MNWWEFEGGSELTVTSFFGPTVRFKGGGGGGSGSIEYPAYIESTHAEWLDDSGGDHMPGSLTDYMDAAVTAGNPWTAAVAYDPAADITAYEAAITAFAALLAGITYTTDWGALLTYAVAQIGARTAIAVGDLVIADEVVGDAVAVADLVILDQTVLDFGVADIVVPDATAVADEVVADAIVADEAAIADIAVADMAVVDMTDSTDVAGMTEAVIVADVDAFADQLDDEIVTKVLPRFRRGMQDINAVVSSAYPIGLAIIESFRDREVAKHNSAIRLMAEAKNIDVDIRNEELHLEVRKDNLGKDIEVAKANIVKDLQVDDINLKKDLQISGNNLNKDVQVAQINVPKNVQIGGINVEKDVKLSLANLSKDLQVDADNMGKDVDIGRINQEKDIKIDTLNVDKDIKLGMANRQKDIVISTADLTKNTQVGVANLTKDVDVGKINIVKDVQVGEIEVRYDGEYERMYLEGTSQMLRYMIQRFTFEESYTKMVVEGSRIKIVANKEEMDVNLRIGESDALFDMEVYQYGANLLAAAGGGTAATGKQPSLAQSAIGGALSGAASGAMVGSVVPGIGTAVGAVAGGIMGAASAFL